MVLNHLSSSLRDKSRSFPKAEGFNPQGVFIFLMTIRSPAGGLKASPTFRRLGIHMVVLFFSDRQPLHRPLAPFAALAEGRAELRGLTVILSEAKNPGMGWRNTTSTS